MVSASGQTWKQGAARHPHQHEQVTQVTLYLCYKPRGSVPFRVRPACSCRGLAAYMTRGSRPIRWRVALILPMFRGLAGVAAESDQKRQERWK